MTLKRIKYSIVFVVMFFSFVNLAYAGLEITEIMYMPENGSNYEWVEIFNNGSTSIDLNKYRFFHGETSGPITLKSGATTVLQSSKYAIIAKSLSSGYSWLDFSGPIFSAGTLSLPDSSSGEYNTYIAISDADKNIINDITYDTSKGGSKTSKTSLSKINGEWKSATPTPGIANSSSDSLSDNSLDNNTDNSVDETVESIPVINNTPIVYKISTKIISSKIVTVGVPFSINHTTMGLNKEKIILGKFVWNFGDGMKKESATSDPFEYSYQYPGEYVISLSYYDSVFSIKPDAIDRVTIKVIPSGINIIGVGTLADPYIEIENNSSYEMSLNKWILKGSVHSFMIPEGMVILPNKKLKLSPKITGFDFNDLSSINITDQSGQVFATYPKQKIYQDVPLIKYSATKNSQGNIIKTDIIESDPIENGKEIINLNDLGASAINSNDLNNLSKGFYVWLGLIIIIIVGIISIILIRRKEEYPDYVEEKITANDMKIIE